MMVEWCCSCGAAKMFCSYQCDHVNTYSVIDYANHFLCSCVVWLCLWYEPHVWNKWITIIIIEVTPKIAWKLTQVNLCYRFGPWHCNSWHFKISPITSKCKFKLICSTLNSKPENSQSVVRYHYSITIIGQEKGLSWSKCTNFVILMTWYIREQT